MYLVSKYSLSAVVTPTRDGFRMISKPGGDVEYIFLVHGNPHRECFNFWIVAIMQLFTFLQDQFPQSLLILTLEGEPLSARRAEYGLLNLTPVEVIQ